MSATSTPKWVVRCDDYTSKPYRDRDAAQRRLASVAKICAIDLGEDPVAVVRERRR